MYDAKTSNNFGKVVEVDLEAAKRFHNSEKIFLPKLLKIQN